MATPDHDQDAISSSEVGYPKDDETEQAMITLATEERSIDSAGQIRRQLPSIPQVPSSTTEGAESGLFSMTPAGVVPLFTPMKEGLKRKIDHVASLENPEPARPVKAKKVHLCSEGSVETDEHGDVSDLDSDGYPDEERRSDDWVLLDPDDSPEIPIPHMDISEDKLSLTIDAVRRPSPVSVKRCLFPVSKDEESDDSLEKEMKQIDDENSKKSIKWNYDFDKEKPFDGIWEWKPDESAPSFYRAKEIKPKPGRRTTSISPTPEDFVSPSTSSTLSSYPPVLSDEEIQAKISCKEKQNFVTGSTNSQSIPESTLTLKNSEAPSSLPSEATSSTTPLDGGALNLSRRSDQISSILVKNGHCPDSSSQVQVESDSSSVLECDASDGISKAASVDESSSCVPVVSQSFLKTSSTSSKILTRPVRIVTDASEISELTNRSSAFVPVETLSSGSKAESSISPSRLPSETSLKVHSSSSGITPGSSIQSSTISGGLSLVTASIPMPPSNFYSSRSLPSSTDNQAESRAKNNHSIKRDQKKKSSPKSSSLSLKFFR